MRYQRDREGLTPKQGQVLSVLRIACHRHHRFVTVREIAALMGEKWQLGRVRDRLRALKRIGKIRMEAGDRPSRDTFAANGVSCGPDSGDIQAQVVAYYLDTKLSIQQIADQVGLTARVVDLELQRMGAKR